MKNKAKVSKSVRILGKVKESSLESLLLKAQAFLEQKKFRVTELHSRSVHAVAYFMKHKATEGQEVSAEEVLKSNTTYLRVFGSDTREAIELITGREVKKLQLKEGNDNLCFRLKFLGFIKKLLKK